MTEAVLVVWLAVIGFGVLSPLWSSVPAWGIGAMALPAGVAAYLMASFALLVVDLGFSTAAGLLVASLGGALMLVIGGRHPGVPLSEMLVTFGVVVGACGLGAMVFQNVHVARLTADSVRYLVSAEALESGGSLDVVDAWDLRMRQLGVPLLHSGGVVAGRGYLASITPLLAGAGLATAGWVAWEGFAMWATPTRWRWLLLGATGALVVSTNRFVYHAFYLNGHMVFAVFLLVGVGATWVAARRGTWALLIPAAVAFGPMAFLRPEAVVTAAVFLIPLLSTAAISIRLRWALAAPFLVATTLWHGVAYPARAIAGDLNLFGPVYGNLFIVAGIIGLLVLGGLSPSRRFVLYAPWLLLAGLAGYVGLEALRDPTTVEESLAATGSNVAVSGLWGTFWWIVPLFVVGGLLVIRFREQSMWTMPLFGYGMALLAFAYLREDAYRVGTGDSGSRMLAHVSLVAVVYVVLAAAAALAEDPAGAEARVPDEAGAVRGGDRSRLRGVA